MKKNPKLIIILILVLIFWAFLIYNLVWLKRDRQKEGSGPPEETKPAITAIDEAVEKIRREGGTIPFNYQVVAIKEGQAELIGAKGKVVLTNDPLIKIFLKKANRILEAGFADLKVGQNLMIEKAPPPSRQYKVFILED